MALWVVLFIVWIGHLTQRTSPHLHSSPVWSHCPLCEMDKNPISSGNFAEVKLQVDLCCQCSCVSELDVHCVGVRGKNTEAVVKGFMRFWCPCTSLWTCSEVRDDRSNYLFGYFHILWRIHHHKLCPTWPLHLHVTKLSFCIIAAQN